MHMKDHRPEKLGLVRLLRPEKYQDTALLTPLQAHDPKRIPVIFVHGLDSTPATWAPMINALRKDSAPANVQPVREQPPTKKKPSKATASR